MQQVKSYYRYEGGYYLLELKLATARQLFNSLDPAPFHEKDLDTDAEEYIVGAAAEFHLKTPVKLVIKLPANERNQQIVGDMTQGIRHYFRYRAEIARRELVRTLRQGRTALLIGLGFLFLCILFQQGIALYDKEGLLWTILEEGFLISGWVAMWHPIDVFLYHWWPIRRQQRIYEKIAAMPIEVRSDLMINHQ